MFIKILPHSYLIKFWKLFALGSESRNFSGGFMASFHNPAHISGKTGRISIGMNVLQILLLNRLNFVHQRN